MTNEQRERACEIASIYEGQPLNDRDTTFTVMRHPIGKGYTKSGSCIMAANGNVYAFVDVGGDPFVAAYRAQKAIQKNPFNVVTE